MEIKAAANMILLVLFVIIIITLLSHAGDTLVNLTEKLKGILTYR